MSESLTIEECAGFRAYAESVRTEQDGSLCQWADYAIRLLDEAETIRAEVKSLKRAYAFVRAISDDEEDYEDLLSQPEVNAAEYRHAMEQLSHVERLFVRRDALPAKLEEAEKAEREKGDGPREPEGGPKDRP